MLNETGTFIDLSNVTIEASACFKRGTHIELSNGYLRRVEDIRTEDFIQSAMRSQQYVKEATVVKIDVNGQCPQVAAITFSYDNNYAKIHLTVQSWHPIFVYGQGWASCNPQLSHQLFQLNCQLLQVGDICLSLGPHDDAPSPPIPSPPPPSRQPAAFVSAPMPGPNFPDALEPIDLSYGYGPNPSRMQFEPNAQMVNYVSNYSQMMGDNKQN
ncbi:ataxin-1 [Drosophila grimshawi]|uniref:GH24531 n=1 Tax=Drosophila grimshawi TaxID=7222 RepID=B4JLV8_DROGR|nr:ataxin-1 [Drosophila grimshawi]EDV91719.1 GH24531 [Drosophila grimshawi]